MYEPAPGANAIRPPCTVRLWLFKLSDMPGYQFMELVLSSKVFTELEQSNVICGFPEILAAVAYPGIPALQLL